MDPLIDHLFLFFYIITVGFTSATVSLSMLYWMKRRDSIRFKTFIFIAYLAFLLLLGGVKFYWEELLSGGRGVTLGTDLAEFLGYALLLYYLPATVNHIAHRKWTALRLAMAITASSTYFVLGTVYVFTGFLKPIFLAAALLYIIALAGILIDITRGIHLIKKRSSRASVLLITLLTISFLPLVMVGRLLDGSGEVWEISQSLRFLFLSIYYFLMALAGNVYFIREMSQETEREDEKVEFPSNLPLTPREKDIANSIIQGLTHNEIAENLNISPHTVRNHTAKLYKKLSIRSKIELVNIFNGNRNFL